MDCQGEDFMGEVALMIKSYLHFLSRILVTTIVELQSRPLLNSCILTHFQ